MDALSTPDRGNPMSPAKVSEKRVERLSPHYQQILKNIPLLPDIAVIPVPVAALIEGVSRRTIKRTYPRVKLSEHREGVLLGYLRRKREVVAAA
jgi:hypothetical protein